ncbi:tryptase-2-like isoform X3 [Thunnus albacares]|uniref:tryptase-2-like isoform X3 n=1 Tax=Thunnus albacares TaxID=8236 RepID=UPI001CF693A1|nr:tryptase-2-like isoform X3 [Thunnus albacares]
MAFCKLLTVLVLIHNTGGLLGAEVKSSIVGGKDAVKDRWPWMVHINITTSEGTENWRCGGSIASDQWVLTAASCWDDQRKPSLRRSMVWIGAYKLHEAPTRYVGINDVYKHPQYRSFAGGYQNNIALVWLKKKLTDTQGGRVDLPKANVNLHASSDCWIAGWGNIKNDVPLPSPETLQELKIPITSDNDCKAAYPWLTSKELCAGDKAEGTCTGDEGGPLACRVGGRFVQAGIVSYESCKPGKGPGLYTRVSEYLDFINSYIHRGEEASAEV